MELEASARTSNLPCGIGKQLGFVVSCHDLVIGRWQPNKFISFLFFFFTNVFYKQHYTTLRLV